METTCISVGSDSPSNNSEYEITEEEKQQQISTLMSQKSEKAGLEYIMKNPFLQIWLNKQYTPENEPISEIIMYMDIPQLWNMFFFVNIYTAEQPELRDSCGRRIY
jgi:hypothetical protein